MQGQKGKWLIVEHSGRRKKRIYTIGMLTSGIIFFCCLAGLAVYFISLWRAEDQRDAMLAVYSSERNGSGKEIGYVLEQGMTRVGMGVKQRNVGEDRAEAEERDTGEAEKGEPEAAPIDLSAYGIMDRSIDWQALQEAENKDIYAWIVVPGTVIDYPVVQHPQELNYYLNHNLDGSTGYPGCIYTQYLNSRDWSDRNTVLYGHNMRIGTMFAGLHDFMNADFFDENRYIHIYAEDGRILVYEIFAAYEFSDAHLLTTFDFSTDTGYGKYLDSIRESADSGGHFREEVEAGTDDKIITLSTCISHRSSKRYLVQGVLIAEACQQ